ncbi:uncharacterized protein LOC122655372 [Telopea speciosissima]|uniref:uncharacterized protein LOC122655372 n=1 Tax=Telopea speciosissima TaxID=54955 RepID=UPI001CC3C811|nr:uncharacterized protein LOC122655372 [Telopea speciosissima]
MGSSSIDNVKWTQVELKIFIEFMIDNVKCGNKTASTFNKTGWNDIKTRMENYLGRSISNEQLRNKIYKLRTEYSNFKKLLDTTGFGWHSMTRTATVDDESANPTWSKFKKNGLSYWPELCIIFEDSYARGNIGSCSTEPIIDMTEGNEDNIVYTPPPTERFHDNIDGFEENENSNKSVRDSTPPSRRKKSMTGDAITSLNQLGRYMNWKMEKATSTSVTSPIRGACATSEYSASACQAILDSIDDVPKDQYVKTIDRMCVDPVWREIFITAKPEKWAWILDGLK